MPLYRPRRGTGRTRTGQLHGLRRPRSSISPESSGSARAASPASGHSSSFVIQRRAPVGPRLERRFASQAETGDHRGQLNQALFAPWSPRPAPARRGWRVRDGRSLGRRSGWAGAMVGSVFQTYNSLGWRCCGVGWRGRRGALRASGGGSAAPSRSARGSGSVGGWAALVPFANCRTSRTGTRCERRSAVGRLAPSCACERMSESADYAKISLITWQGSTPVSLASRPWNLTEKRSWSKPSNCRIVAWKSRMCTGLSTMLYEKSSVSP